MPTPCTPPDGAIRVAEDLYQVPVGRDKAGYLQYTQWSCRLLVPTVIWYRDADGGFTTNRDQAAREPEPQR